MQSRNEKSISKKFLIVTIAIISMVMIIFTLFIESCGALGNLFRCFELAQLTGGGLGRSKPATNLMQAHQHTVWRFYYIQALLNCLL